MEKFADFSSSLFSNVSYTTNDIDDCSNEDDDDDYDKCRKQRKVESNNSHFDGDTSGGGTSGDEYTASSVFSDNLRFDDYLAKYRITFTDDVRSNSGSDSETDGGGHTIALSSSDEMESESVVEQKMANTAQKLHEIFVEGCCALYNDLQNAIEDAEGGRSRATMLDDHENDAAKDNLTSNNVQTDEEAVVVEMEVAELLNELSGRHRVLERQARQLADDWPKLADAAGARIRTLTRAMHRLRCAATAVEQQQQRRRNVSNNNELAKGTAKDTTPASASAAATATTIPSAAAHFRRWLHTSEKRLNALKEAVAASVAAFNNNYSAQQQQQQQQHQQQQQIEQPEFCRFDERNNKLLSSLQRLRAEHQALQLQIESDGRALLNAAQLCAENKNNKNCGVENAAAKRTVDRWRRNVDALRNRWHAHWLASLELRQRLDERIDRLTNRSERTSATLSRYASDEDGDEDTDSSAGREPLCKRLRRSCGHNSPHNHSQQLLSLALESPLPPDDQQPAHAADDVAAATAAVAVKLKKSDAQSVASYSSGIETASSSMPSSAREVLLAGGAASTVCRCHYQQRGQMAPCNSENKNRAPSSAPTCEEAPVGPSSAASTSAPDIGYSSGENNSVASEELPSAMLNKKSPSAENLVVEKLLSDVKNEEATEADVLPEECGGKLDDFASASALLTRSYYKMVPLDDAGVTDTELTGGMPRFLFHSSTTPPPSGATTGGGNPHLTDSVIVHIDNCCCGGGGGGLPRQQQQQLNLSASTEHGGDDADRDSSVIGDDFEEVMGIMDEQFNAHLQRLHQHGTQWRELRSAKPVTACDATTTGTQTACAASSVGAVRRVFPLVGGLVGGNVMDKASCDASSEDEDSAPAVAALDGGATSPPPAHSVNSSGSLQRRRKRFHRRSAQNATALQPPRSLGGDVFAESYSTVLTLRLANVLMDQSVYITGHSSDEEANNNSSSSNNNNNSNNNNINSNGDDFSSTPSQQLMMSRSWLGTDAASGGSSSLRRSPLAVMSRSAVLDGEKLPPTAFRRRRRALRRRTTTGFTSASRALQNSFLRLAQEQRAEEEMSNANLLLPPLMPSGNNNDGGGEPQLLLNNNQYHYHYYHHCYDNVKVDSSGAKVMSNHQLNHYHRRHHSASHHVVPHRRRAESITSIHSSSSSSSSNASAHPEESGDAHYEWDDYRDPCDLLMPPSCLHLDRELNNNNNTSNTDEHQLKRFVDNQLSNNNCAEKTTSSVIDCCFVDYTRKPSSAVSQQLVPPTLIDDDDFGVELPELLFVDGSTNGSGNSSLSDDVDEPTNNTVDFSASFAVVRPVERMLRDSRGALNSVENLLRRGAKRDNSKQQAEENSKFIHATARENLKKLTDAAMQLDSSAAATGVNREQLTQLDALRQRWNRLVARLERHNRRRQQQKQHFKNNNADEKNSCSGASSSSGSEKEEHGGANGGRRSTTVSISLHAILDDMKAQLHLLMLSDRTLHPPLRLAEVEEVVATRKKIFHTLLALRDDLRELAAGAAASASLSAQSAKPAVAEGDDALELWALVDLVETSLHSIERSTLALERLRTDFGALCAAFRHLEAKIDRLLVVSSADDDVSDKSRKSVERELELCQERMDALETACNTLSGQLAIIPTPPPAPLYAEAVDGEEAPPDEPSPPRASVDAFGAAMFADELTRFRDELSRLTLRFQSSLSANSQRCQTARPGSGSEEEKDEGKIRSTMVTPTTKNSQNSQPQPKKAFSTNASANRKRRFFAAKFTQTINTAADVQSVGTQSAISAETFREYAERIAARKAAKRRTAATTTITNGSATMKGGSTPTRKDKRKTALKADATTTVTALRRRGSVVKDKCATETDAASTATRTRLPQRLRVALRDSRLAQLCLGCAIAAALGLLLLTIMAATGTDERNPLLANNYRWTFGPQLTYVQGPPPV